MNSVKHSFEAKKALVALMTRPILDFIHSRTVVVAAYKDTAITDHGAGLLVEINGDLLCATAGHVVAPYSLDQIQVIASEKPSDLRMGPIEKDSLGCGRQSEDDVAILRLPEKFIRAFPAKRFHSIHEIEIDPQLLGTDLAIVCGAPETDHLEEEPKFHRFQTFTFITSFTGGLDWTPPFGEAPLIEVPFPTETEDTLTGRTVQLPEAYGMSGGGMWRANLKPGQIWHSAGMRIVGLNSEFHKARRLVYATRSFKLLSLLARHYDLARAKIDREVRWTM